MCNVFKFIPQVSLCAGCNVYEPWAALLVGGGAGIAYFGVHTAMLRSVLYFCNVLSILYCSKLS